MPESISVACCVPTQPSSSPVLPRRLTLSSKTPSSCILPCASLPHADSELTRGALDEHFLLSGSGDLDTAARHRLPGAFPALAPLGATASPQSPGFLDSRRSLRTATTNHRPRNTRHAAPPHFCSLIEARHPLPPPTLPGPASPFPGRWDVQPLKTSNCILHLAPGLDIHTDLFKSA